LTATSPSTRVVPRVTLTRAEAAEALGISIDSFERHVQPELRVIRRGRMRLVPLSELERWVKENASLTLDGVIRSGA
jgi:excisionase family DNA binding protein